MKKKILAFAVACVLVLGFPAAAFAAQFNSPSGTTVTGDNGVALSVSGKSVFGDGFIHVEPLDDRHASNVPKGVTPLASFHVWADDVVEMGTLKLTFNVGSQYAGQTAKVYIEYEGDDPKDDDSKNDNLKDDASKDDDFDVIEVEVAANGTFSVEISRAAYLSVVIDDAADGKTAATQNKVDTSATSPQTSAGSKTSASATAGRTAVSDDADLKKSAE